MSETAFVCPNCQAPNPSADVGAHCRFCGGELIAPVEALPLPEDEALELVIEDAEPPSMPPRFEAPEEFELLDLPEAVVAPVSLEPPVAPVLKAVRSVPVARLPEVDRPEHSPPKQLSVRSEPREPEENAKPKIFLALLVLLGVLLAFVLGLSVIIYAVWMGFKSVAKPQAAAEVATPGPEREVAKSDPAPPQESTVRPVPSAKAELSPIPNFAPDQIFPITPSALRTKSATIDLPGTVTNSRVGGGGRFFILWYEKLRRLDVFDTNRSEIVKSLTVRSDEVHFAAGMSDLFLFDNATRTIDTYNFNTWSKSPAKSYPFRGKVLQTCMGSASMGPILVSTAAGSLPDDPTENALLDGRTLEPVRYPGPGAFATGVLREVVHYRANPSGTIFSRWQTSPPQKLEYYSLTKDGIRSHSAPMSGIAIPTDNDLLVTALGLYDLNGVAVSGDGESHPLSRLRVPAQSGQMYLSCPGGGGGPHPVGATESAKPTKLFLLRNWSPLWESYDLELPISSEGFATHDFLQDRRVHFVPEAKLIAIVPNSNDRLVLHRFDPFEEMAKRAKQNVIGVINRPTLAVPGEIYRLPIEVANNTGKIQKYELVKGPSGMSITSDGRIIWDVPSDASGFYAVTVKITTVNFYASYTMQIPVRARR